MKTKLLCLGGLFFLIISCERVVTVNPSIIPVSLGICKSHDLKAATDQSSNQDCIEYSWLRGDTLLIKHVNAGFNCCPDGYKLNLDIKGDTLIITESENSSLCDCNCLYDLDYKLAGIEKNNWFIKVVEPYVQQADDQKMLFKAELKKNTRGEYCITRTNYPWGI